MTDDTAPAYAMVQITINEHRLDRRAPPKSSRKGSERPSSIEGSTSMTADSFRRTARSRMPNVARNAASPTIGKILASRQC